MARVLGPQIFRTDQKCNNCPGMILMRPQWDDSSGYWGGQETGHRRRARDRREYRAAAM
jgi:hypothetical protein